MDSYKYIMFFLLLLSSMLLARKWKLGSSYVKRGGVKRLYSYEHSLKFQISRALIIIGLALITHGIYVCLLMGTTFGLLYGTVEGKQIKEMGDKLIQPESVKELKDILRKHRLSKYFTIINIASYASSILCATYFFATDITKIVFFVCTTNLIMMFVARLVIMRNFRNN